MAQNEQAPKVTEQNKQNEQAPEVTEQNEQAPKVAVTPAKPTEDMNHEQVRDAQIKASATAVAKLDEFRETKGYTVREVAQVFGINDQSIYATRSEKNPMSFSTLIVLAHATGLSLAALLDEHTRIDPDNEAVASRVARFASTASERERERLTRQREKVEKRLASLDAAARGTGETPTETPAKAETKTPAKGGDKAKG